MKKRPDSLYFHAQDKSSRGFIIIDEAGNIKRFRWTKLHTIKMEKYLPGREMRLWKKTYPHCLKGIDHVQDWNL